MRHDHRFFSTMAIVTSVTIVAGFFNTYGPKVAAGGAGLPGIIHLHAVVATAWLVVFVTQTTLVRKGRTDLHRRLGSAAMLLAVLMFVVGIATAITSARLGHTGIPGVEFPDTGGFLLLNLGAVAVFAALVGAGWYFRRDPQTHKRLMLMAMTGALVGPGVSRLPYASGRPAVIGLLVTAFLLAGPVYDLVTRRRVHPAYLWGLAVSLTTVPPVVTAAAATPVWRHIAEWLIG